MYGAEILPSMPWLPIPRMNQIRDHVGGLADLAARRLRVVGDPMARLQEDRLRVLRGLRFAAHLDLTIDEVTWAALRDTAPIHLSRERIWQEWSKLMRYQSTPLVGLGRFALWPPESSCSWFGP